MAVDMLGLTGAQGSGKDAIADMLVKRHGWIKISFGDAVRECLWVMNPTITDKRILGGFDDYQNLVLEHGYDTAKRRYPEIRRMLQVLATDAVRNIIDEDTWANIWLERTFIALTKGRKVVAPDVRFPNEIQAIKNGPGEGIIGHVIRPGIEKDDDHVSEQQELPHDFPIANNGSLENLKATVDALVVQLND